MSPTQSTGPKGIGIGLRRELVHDLLANKAPLPCFVELAPENWVDVGGYWGNKLKAMAERYPITCHGLSLSLGSPDPLDWEFLKKVKLFFKQLNITRYTEHLSYAKCDNAHLYDLLPIPFRKDAVVHVSERIRQVQDFLGMRIAIENISYYTPVEPEMSEVEFINEIIDAADCELLLDINNVYVNAFNHGYEARSFIQALPLDRVTYLHMAGHEQRSPTLIIDTHGAPIIDSVYDLFSFVAPKLQPAPVLLERDFEIPALDELLIEAERLNEIAARHWDLSYAA